MKTLLRVFAVTAFLTLAGIVSASAQDEKCPDLAQCFEQFKAELNKPCGDRAKAVELAAYIGEKFKDDTENAELIKKIVARGEKIKEDDRLCNRNRAWDKSYKDKSWDSFFALSKEIINDTKNTPRPLALDVIVTAADTGFSLTTDSKIDTYNNETVNFAKTAIQQIEGGAVSQSAAKNGSIGIFNAYKNKDEALAWLNYSIAFIYDTKLSRKDESISYYYKSSMHAPKSTDPYVFQRIGTWYVGKAMNLYEEYKTIYEANSKLDTEEGKAKVAEANGKLALARGYAERAIDAFGRAQRLASDPKYSGEKYKAFKTTLTDSLAEFYKFRFNGKSDGQDVFVSSLISKPMPDPTSTVAPVIIEETATTTPTTPATPATTPAKPTTPATKPTTTPATKPATTGSTTVKPATSSVKKPTNKKKGTR